MIVGQPGSSDLDGLLGYRKSHGVVFDGREELAVSDASSSRSQLVWTFGLVAALALVIALFG
jgi:hypothetical protein